MRNILGFLRTMALFVLGIAITAVLALTGRAGQQTADGRQLLSGHVPAAVAGLQALDRLSATNRLALAITLPSRNPEVLADLLLRLYDPSSPDYHHYLTPVQFTEQFGATEQDYQSVMAFAKAQGFIVTATHPNRLVLDVNATIPDIERAFKVTMRVYPHPKENRTFYAPDSDPSLNLATPILRISGLDNYALPHPQLKKRPASLTTNVAPNAGSGPSGNFMGHDFRAAYVPDTTLTGAGQSVGLLQFDGYTASDITYYENVAGLPNITLQNVLIDGATGAPDGGNGDVEVCLDIEMVASMAPGISKIIVYMAPNPSPWVDLLSRMANDNLAKQLSCSWGGGPPDAACETIFQQMAAQGQTFFDACGDSDAFTGPIDFPADSPHIAVVGGTTLTTSGPGGTWVSEKVWNWGGGIGTCGGTSTYYAIPTWQQGVSMASNKGSTAMRNVPDVALTADNIYVRCDGADNVGVGGTSCAAPLWAGITALANQFTAANNLAPVGFLNPTVYALGKGTTYTNNFRDTTTGDNTSPASTGKFFAVTGYDLCTGWGTPNGEVLLESLARALVLPGSAYIVTGAPGVPPYVPANRVYTVKNSSTNNLVWQMSNSQPWLHISPTTVTVAPNASATVTATVDQVAATAFAAGTYLDTMVFTNNTGLGACTRQVVLRIGRNYSLQGADYAWIDPVADGHALLNLASGIYGPYALPFDFLFYDATNRSIYVSAYGLLGFDASGLATGDNTTLPNPALPTDIICPLWDDLNANAQGAAVYLGVEGVTPNRKAVVTWLNVPQASDPTALFSFQAILQEGVAVPGINNDIVFNYKDVAISNAMLGSGQSATIGIEDQIGALGRLFSCNGTNWLANQSALRFTQAPQTSTNVPVGQIRFFKKTGSTVTFEVTFNEPVTGLAPTSLLLSGSTIPGITLGAIAGGGFRYLVDVDNVGASLGRVQLSVLAGAVQDYDGNGNAAFGPAVYIVQPTTIDFFDDMEAGMGGWTVTTQIFATIDTHGWQWGVPTFAVGPAAASSPSHCWSTSLQGPCPTNMSRARLTSVPIQVGVDPVLDFDVWCDIGASGTLEVNAGPGWVDVTPVGANGARFYNMGPDWVHETVALDNTVFGSRTIQVRFNAYGGALGYAGLYIDNVAVSSESVPGFWVLSYTPSSGVPSSAVPMTLTVYNSTTNTYANAIGVIGSAEMGVSFTGGVPAVYGTMAPGDIRSNSIPVGLVLGSTGNFTKASIQLTHVAEDGAAILGQQTLPFTVNGITTVLATNTFTATCALPGIGVTNWLGQYLSGNGGPASCLFEAIYAGPDGVISPPQPNGQVSGDDVLLYSTAGIPWGSFGEGGVPSGVGQFKKTFAHNLPAGARVYVRAFDASSFPASVAYGDSPLYTLTGQSAQTHDFGSWAVVVPLDYYRDSNGDSIPDGVAILKGLDPRAPIAPLATAWICNNQFGSGGSGAGQFSTSLPSPTRVAYKGNFLFALDTGNNRLQVWNRFSGSYLGSFGSTGTNTTQFQRPYGLGLDPRPGTNRFAVADQGNLRIQVFQFDPLTGTNVTFLFSFGAGVLSVPTDVAIAPDGRFYVTDSSSVDVFSPIGVYQTNLNGTVTQPWGVAVGTNGQVVVADTGNNCIQGWNSAGAWQWTFGNAGTNAGQFRMPRDVAFGPGSLIYVADMLNSRLVVLRADETNVALVAALPSSSRAPAVTLHLPYSLVPVVDSNMVYVADTGNSRIVALSTMFDTDGDGMDDVWEILNGLDPTNPNDALLDNNGSGILNIGDYRLGLNPGPPMRITAFSARSGSLAWQSVSTGAVYRVDYSSNLAGPGSNSWRTGSIVTSQVAGALSATNLFPMTNGMEFIRVLFLTNNLYKP